MNFWKVILATLVIYCAGVFSGALLVKSTRPVASATPSPSPGPVFPGSDIFQQRFLDRLKKELDLTAKQNERLEIVFQDSRDRMRAWWDIVGPEMQAELQAVREKIRAELKPEQRDKFETLLKSRHHPPGQGAPGEAHGRDRHQPGQRNPTRPSDQPVPPVVPASQNPPAAPP